MQDPAFAERHRVRNREYMRALRQTDERKKYDRERVVVARQQDPLPFLYRAARFRAKKKSQPFDLTIEWARRRWTGRCELTGIPFETSTGAAGPRSPSIDKIIPSIGYTMENCRFVLSAVNSLKGNGSDAEMLFVARRLVEESQRWT